MGDKLAYRLRLYGEMNDPPILTFFNNRPLGEKMIPVPDHVQTPEQLAKLVRENTPYGKASHVSLELYRQSDKDALNKGDTIIGTMFTHHNKAGIEDRVLSVFNKRKELEGGGAEQVLEPPPAGDRQASTAKHLVLGN